MLTSQVEKFLFGGGGKGTDLPIPPSLSHARIVWYIIDEMLGEQGLANSIRPKVE